MPDLSIMAHRAGGRFRMKADGYPEEAPAHNAEVNAFWIDRQAVTNADFAVFVAATGHLTSAEIAPSAEDYPGARPRMLFAGGLDGATYAWGNVFRPGGTHMANTWQGKSRTRTCSKMAGKRRPRSAASPPTAMACSA